MPSLVSAVDVRPCVSYRTIQVGPILFEEAPAEDEIIQIPGDGLTLTSSDNDFFPLVRLEVWDGTPAKPDEAWEYERSFCAPLTDNFVVIDLNGRTQGEITVEPRKHHIRVLCRGRDHYEASLALDPFPPVGPHEDPLEFWVIQLWPA
ncbi:hypothetical protein [Streptomyces kanamyceticus]|uniref:Uncharacterized protein n=1 Tax=Streptomyces kanamyceticus TaxID=1967 RepID=A0A5J6G995_STRKN|nr:hypothetical protein [Streptomyces kanamyceticus]QEU90505.1 hypothetical protein CP970_05890 [Streptomyces kanamyceticus]